MADLQDLETVQNSEAGAVLELMHPNGSPLCDNAGNRMWIKLLGPDSKVGVRHKNAKMVQLVSKITVRKAREGSVSKEKLEDLEEQDDTVDTAGIMADLAVGWYLVWNGESLSFTKENARKVMRTFPWITEQCDEFCAKRTNYLGNLSAP